MRRPRHKRPMRIARPLGGALLLLILLWLPDARSLASFTSTRVAPTMTVSSRSWFYYLHHRPSPPTADTQSTVVDLTMNTSAPTGSTLFHFSTDISNTDLGRVVQRSAGDTGDTNTKHYEDWWGPVASSAHHYTGQATLTIYAQPRTNGGGATMQVSLRDRSSGTAVTDITTVTYARADWSTGGAFSLVAVTLPFAWTLAAGHRFELRIMALNVAKGDQDVILAYDTTTYPSTLRTP